MTVLTAEQVMEKYQIKSMTTLRVILTKKGSPAFKVGGQWRVDEEKLDKWLLKESERLKG